MIGWLFRRRRPADRTRALPPTAPAVPFYAVGDIHGRADLLERLLQAIAAEPGAESATLVFVGDYIDRGDDSAAVLERLRALEAARPGAVICLLGNHERMMLDFLDDPAAKGRRWLRNGGLQTLLSFGAGLGGTAIGEALPADDRERLAEVLRSRLPEGLEAWLRSRPLTWQSGNVAVTHAGADPARPLAEQGEDTLIWGHEAFFEMPREDGLWIVHGHTMCDAPTAEAGRIGIDTGAVFTGRLTAAALAPGAELRFLQG